MARLKKVDCSDPGITRRRNGRGFLYLYPDGSKVTDPEVLAHLKDLVIPPAWKDVWICPYPNGHLQAVGTDAAGRKQYLYHPRWRQRRDQQKFDRMVDFARRLPEVRERCVELLGADGFGRDRVLACAVRLLDRGFFRIGTEGYAEQNETYGLATLLKRHVNPKAGDVLLFDFPSKGRKRRIQSVVDPDVYELVVALKRRRAGGPELLAYKFHKRWADVTSGDINAFVKQVAGEAFSAKDFRTWNATVLAATTMAVSGGVARSKSARKRAIAYAVQTVAHYLGNTPAIARSSYIDPRIFDRYRSGWTISGAIEELGGDVDLGAPSTQGAIERAVLDLLERNTDSDAVEPTRAAFDELALSA